MHVCFDISVLDMFCSNQLYCHALLLYSGTDWLLKSDHKLLITSASSYEFKKWESSIVKTDSNNISKNFLATTTTKTKTKTMMGIFGMFEGNSVAFSIPGVGLAFPWWCSSASQQQGRFSSAQNGQSVVKQIDWSMSLKKKPFQTDVNLCPTVDLGFCLILEIRRSLQRQVIELLGCMKFLFDWRFSKFPSTTEAAVLLATTFFPDSDSDSDSDSDGGRELRVVLKMTQFRWLQVFVWQPFLGLKTSKVCRVQNAILGFENQWP